ncbi:sigma-70 family RNA polymerase sigma factor [Bacillus sp. BGMRC 2118]|nr:sigma-70 family RNA polymerase sigma factor [Bacillus sp. BGMRC 2118]
MTMYGSTILRIVYSYVKDEQIAEDLTQDIFVKAFKNLHTFKGEASMKTWLIRIATNHAKDYLRSWHYKTVIVKEFVGMGSNSTDRTPEQQLLDKVEYSALTQAIFGLPTKYREIIILFYYQDLTLKEISEILSINVNTIKSRMTRGRTLLREKMSENSEEGSIREL